MSPNPYVEVQALIERRRAAMTPDEARAYFLRSEVWRQALLYGQVDGPQAVVGAARKFADWRRQHETKDCA